MATTAEQPQPKQPPVPPRSAHVLFVHGVGRHSKLSSLLRPYQSLRSNMRSDEAPVESEDPFKRWTLQDFDDAANPVFLKLRPPEDDPDEARDVYLYEVNYSALAGVVRANQQLDMTHLFVSLDLAVNVARDRLATLLADAKKMEERAFDWAEVRHHRQLARAAQGLTGVLVAATVPVLGLPSMALRKYIGTFVADFTRFFEDVATFALDRNGSALINAHFDHTVRAIQSKLGSADEFVVVAHSLGTVVAHSHLVRTWSDYRVPDRVVTLGSPIGMVSWLWRLLDFEGAKFDPYGRHDTPYFCWTPLASKKDGRALEWINVVNYLDPIATAFPLTDAYLGMPRERLEKHLAGGAVQQHFIRTGGFFSVGAAHTRYFQDKDNFLKLLGKVIPLSPEEAARPDSRDPAQHWKDTGEALLLWQSVLWAAGLAFLAGYFWLLARIAGPGVTWQAVIPFPLVLYVLPGLTIGTLAFFQRLVVGAPTKRTRAQDVIKLPWWRLTSLPYRIPHFLGLRRSDPPLDKPAPPWFWLQVRHGVSFLPTLVAMAIPVWWLQIDGPYHGILDLLRYGVSDFVAKAGWWYSLALVGLFMAYTVAFAGSEFARHWRKVLKLCGLPGQQERTT